ncbi:DMSO/TMAO reductase YedYZ, heme-binding membrane subunit [Streptomyces sp. AmelKG-D3]|nr:DMSO/TMAO reductase YedYZ, heme-binding membrane subunit [Streptomyces sp. AmelKG-D3]
MNPHRKIRVSPSMSPGMSRPVQGGLTVVALVFIPLLAVAGSDALRATLDFTTGVLSLVSLSAAVAWGLLATDRLFLSTRQRIVCQGVHRATAVAALGFLLLHGTVKVALGHVSLIGALIPFGLGVTETAGLIGFGSLAGLLMVVTAATGALRSAFAQPPATATRLGQSLGAPREAGGIAGRWRALHALAYPAWCAALIHGLYAGRPPATWVVVMYGLCLTGVAGALCLRLLPRPTKRRITDRIAALLDPDAGFDMPDPVLRGPVRSGPEREGPPGGPMGGRAPEGEVRGTPVRPRTLSAPPMPPPVRLSGSYGTQPPHGMRPLDETQPLPYETRPLHGASPPRETSPLHGARPPYETRSLHEAPTEVRYGTEPSYGFPSPVYEPPPRPSDRLADGPAGGPGISAGYRAVSQAGGPARAHKARWPAPSPAPPAQAHHGPPGAEHTYAPPQEPPLYTPPVHTEPPLHTTPPSGPPIHSTAESTPSFDTAPIGAAGPAEATPSPYRAAAPAPEPHTGIPAPTPVSRSTPSPGPGAGPFSAPPAAGEPWHAPAGDRP